MNEPSVFKTVVFAIACFAVAIIAVVTIRHTMFGKMIVAVLICCGAIWLRRGIYYYSENSTTSVPD